MKIIYLKPDEEIISIIDQLNQAEEKQLTMVVPSGAQLWHNLINLRLLKREADNLNKQVIFVTDDQWGEEMAQRAGFTVKKETNLPLELIEEEAKTQQKEFVKEPVAQADLSVAQSGQAPKKKESSRADLIDRLSREIEAEKALKGKTFFNLPFRSKKTKQKPMADIVSGQPKKPARFKKALAEKKKTETLIKVFRQPESIPQTTKEKGTSWFKRLFWGLSGLGIILVLLISYFVLPSVEIIIKPKTEEMSFDLLITGSADLSQVESKANKIPVQIIRADKSQTKEFESTGQKQLNEKAKGIITVYNEYSSSPQTLVATTRFESPEGKIFRLTKTVTIPGAQIVEGKIVPSSKDVQVAADQPGEEYNIGPTEFTIPGFKGTAKYSGFYGRSKQAMTGGSTALVKVVSLDDLDRAEGAFADLLKEEVEKELKSKIPQGLKLIEETLQTEMSQTVFSAEPGEQVDRFSVEKTAQAQAFLYRPDDLSQLIEAKLKERIAENKEPVAGSQQISWQAIETNWPNNQLQLSLKIKEKVFWQIKVDQLKRDLAGQSEREVRRYLASQEGIKEAKVSFKPFWVKRVPLQEEKIKITIKIPEE